MKYIVEKKCDVFFYHETKTIDVLIIYVLNAIAGSRVASLLCHGTIPNSVVLHIKNNGGNISVILTNGIFFRERPSSF
jgi:hypothetical protein